MRGGGWSGCCSFIRGERGGEGKGGCFRFWVGGGATAKRDGAPANNRSLSLLPPPLPPSLPARSARTFPTLFMIYLFLAFPPRGPSTFSPLCPFSCMSYPPFPCRVCTLLPCPPLFFLTVPAHGMCLFALLYFLFVRCYYSPSSTSARPPLPSITPPPRRKPRWRRW